MAASASSKCPASSSSVQPREMAHDLSRSSAFGRHHAHRLLEVRAREAELALVRARGDVLADGEKPALAAFLETGHRGQPVRRRALVLAAPPQRLAQESVELGRDAGAR